LINQLELGPLPNVLSGPEGSHLFLVGNGEALSAFGAAALQHLAAILGRHPHQEAMALGPAAGVGLKRSLALLRSSHFSPLTKLTIIGAKRGRGHVLFRGCVVDFLSRTPESKNQQIRRIPEGFGC
jgi:hypothetical protein